MSDTYLIVDRLWLLTHRSALNDTLAMPEHEAHMQLRGLLASVDTLLAQAEGTEHELAMITSAPRVRRLRGRVTGTSRPPLTDLPDGAR